MRVVVFVVALLSLTCLPVFADAAAAGRFTRTRQKLFTTTSTLSLTRIHTTKTTTKRPFLAALSVSDNNLTGPLPASVGAAAGIIQLLLDENGFTGTIPDSYKELSQAVIIDLSNNNLDVNVGLPPWLIESKYAFCFFVLLGVLGGRAVLCCAAPLCLKPRTHTHTTHTHAQHTSVSKVRSNDSSGEHDALCPAVEYRDPYAPAIFQLDASYFGWCADDVVVCCCLCCAASRVVCACAVDPPPPRQPHTTPSPPPQKKQQPTNKKGTAACASATRRRCSSPAPAGT